MNETPPRLPENFWRDFWQTDRLMLAPMEGVVDPVMRDLMTRIGGVDLCVTEFVRVTDRLLPMSDYRKYFPEMFENASHTKAGTPVLLQLLGGQAGPVAENAGFATHELGALGIDLNFGCPAKTVNRHDGGATLLKNPERIHEVVSAVRRAVPADRPVSAKVRLGFSDKILHREIALAAQSGGASWLTVHARTRDEGYRPPAHWEFIASMREALEIPVIANGEIWSHEDFHLCRKASGCRHTMIGRGLMSRPELAREIKALPVQPARKQRLLWLIEFAEMSRTYRHEGYAVSRLKQWCKALARDCAETKELFDRIKILEDLAPMLAVLHSELALENNQENNQPRLNIESSFLSCSSAARSL